MKWISTFVLVMALLIVGEALAQGCTIKAIPVSFGVYEPHKLSLHNATGHIAVTCSPGVSYTLKLDAGNNPAGLFHPRKMRLIGRSGTLLYNLYRDTNHRQVWGDGTNNSFVQTGLGTGGIERFTIYGRIPGKQNVFAGTYSDAIIARIEW